MSWQRLIQHLLLDGRMNDDADLFCKWFLLFLVDFSICLPTITLMFLKVDCGPRNHYRPRFDEQLKNETENAKWRLIRWHFYL